MSGLEPLRWLWTACLNHVVMNSFSWTASHPGSRTSVYFTSQYLFTTEQLVPTIQQISLRWIDPPHEEKPPKVPTNARPLLFPYLCYAKNNYQPQLSRLLPRFNPNASKITSKFLWVFFDSMKDARSTVVRVLGDLHTIPLVTNGHVVCYGLRIWSEVISLEDGRGLWTRGMD